MMINIASFLGGMGLGIVLPGVLARVSELSNVKKGISFVGFVAAAQGLGGITSSFMYQFLLNITGQENGRFTLLLASIGLIILAIAWIAVTTFRKEKDSRTTEIPNTTHII